MNIKKIALILLCAHAYTAATAMEVLNESELSSATGQDGITLGLNFPNSTISYDQVVIKDTDGLSSVSTHTNSASLVLAPTTFNANNGIRLLKSDGSVATSNIDVKMDTDGNANAPFLNVNIKLPSDANRIQISPFSVYLAAGNSNTFSARANGSNVAANVLNSGVKELLAVGGNGININLKQSLGVNIQLANEPQGHMFIFSGSIGCITNSGSCTLSDTNYVPISLKDASGSSFNLGFAMTASNQDTGFRLGSFSGFSGLYADITENGLELGSNGQSDKFDLNLNNIGLGNTVSDGSQFNGLPSGSMGNVGFTGIAVKDFKMTVKGI